MDVSVKDGERRECERARARRESAGGTTDCHWMTPYAGMNRIRFYGTLSACARRGQAPRSPAKSRDPFSSRK